MNAGPSFSAGAFKLYCSVRSEDGISSHKPVTEFQLLVEVAANNSFPYWAPTACLCAQLLSHVWLFVTPWTVACQCPLSMKISRQEYWSGLPFPTWEDLLDSRIEPASRASSSLTGEFFTTAPPGKYGMRASHYRGLSCGAQAVGHMGFSCCGMWAQ